MSAQQQTHSIEMSEFIHWIGEKHEVSVSHADHVSIFPSIKMDTTEATLFDIVAHLDSREDLEYYLDDELQLFLRLPNPKKDKKRKLQLTLRDHVTQKSIELVAVSIPGTSYGAYSNGNGALKLEFPASLEDSVLVCSMLGYDSKEIRINEISGNAKISLRQSGFSVDQVLVEDRKNLISTSKYGHNARIGTNSIGGVSSPMGDDLMRQVQLLPGVLAHQDNNAGIKIRGSKADQTLILVDGIPIYDAGHYFGIFGAINSNYVESAILYKNNLPIQYGEKNGGMLQVDGVDSEAIEELQVVGELSLLTAAASIAGRVDSSWTYRIGGRTTYKNVSNSGFSNLFSKEEGLSMNQNFTIGPDRPFVGSTPNYNFYDLNANLTYSNNHSFKVAANIFKSGDHLSNGFSKSNKLERPLNDVTSLATSQQDESWSNIGGSILAEFQLKKGFRLKGDFYFANFERQDENAIEVRQERRLMDRVFNQRLFTNNSIGEIGTRIYLERESRSNSNLQFGIDVSHHNSLLESNDITARRLRLSEASNMFSGFGSWNKEWKGGWNINGGVRSTYYELTKRVYWSPRIEVSKKISSNLNWKSSFGRQFQLTQNLSFENLYSRNIEVWTLSNARRGDMGAVPVSTLDHVMIGGTWNKDRWTVDAELYHRYSRDITEVAVNTLVLNAEGGVPETNDVAYRFYHGAGTTNGLDLMVAYTGRKFGSLLSYTLSSAMVSIPEISGGDPFPSQLDSRHQLQWVNDYRLGPWTFGASLIYATGRSYTDLNKLGNNNTRENIRPQDRLSRLPDYIRVDAGVDYNFKIGSVNSSIGASLINALDRENVSYIQYTFSLPTQNAQDSRGAVVGNSSNLLARTLNLNWKIKF